VKTLLFDIEGTTTDIRFVHKVLFPYSFERMEEFCRSHSNHPAIREAREVLWKERRQLASLTDVIEAMKLWIRTDRKIGVLKTLQGEIWSEGYKTGAFQGHVYPDVPEAWQRWKKNGFRLAIYSSGSVAAQKQIFGNSNAGDLTILLSDYFDTKVGGKREVKSYQNIALSLKSDACDITFFSDIKEELDAAQAGGMKTIHVFRDGLQLSSHRSITTFAGLSL
jgi:enolase-phosphatase E1